MSYGAFLEFYGYGSEEPIYDSQYLAPGLAAQPNTVYLASTGDGGARYGPSYPSISPLVAGIGGTNLNVSGNELFERVGLVRRRRRHQQRIQRSRLPVRRHGLHRPHQSRRVQCRGRRLGLRPVRLRRLGRRRRHELVVAHLGGFTAVANQGRVLAGGQDFNGSTQQFQSALYSAYTSSNYHNYFNDITTGSNGYPATPGYDLATGIGTPQAQ